MLPLALFTAHTTILPIAPAGIIVHLMNVRFLVSTSFECLVQIQHSNLSHLEAIELGLKLSLRVAGRLPRSEKLPICRIFG